MRDAHARPLRAPRSPTPCSASRSPTSSAARCSWPPSTCAARRAGAYGRGRRARRRGELRQRLRAGALLARRRDHLPGHRQQAARLPRGRGHGGRDRHRHRTGGGRSTSRTRSSPRRARAGGAGREQRRDEPPAYRVKGPAAFSGESRRFCVPDRHARAAPTGSCASSARCSATCGRCCGRCCCSGSSTSIFSEVVKVGAGIEHYPVVLLCGIVLYSYFAEVTGGAVSSVVDRESLVRKVTFPRMAIPLAVALVGDAQPAAQPRHRGDLHGDLTAWSRAGPGCCCRSR